jgi:hypothetical protein
MSLVLCRVLLYSIAHAVFNCRMRRNSKLLSTVHFTNDNQQRQLLSIDCHTCTRAYVVSVQSVDP